MGFRSPLFLLGLSAATEAPPEPPVEERRGPASGPHWQEPRLYRIVTRDGRTLQTTNPAEFYRWAAEQMALEQPAAVEEVTESQATAGERLVLPAPELRPTFEAMQIIERLLIQERELQIASLIAELQAERRQEEMILAALLLAIV